MKKSFQDYAIYFLTLVLGVAIFYMFNSLDSQQAMLQVSESTKQIIQLMIQLLSMVSFFIAVILGLLIVYANHFLVNRRKREFAIYMTLGMGRRQISKIILMETVLVGILSLLAGLVIGVFISQFMSILVAKMFQADMSEFQFVFSKEAYIKTCVYFAIMYVAVMLFNTFTISRYKLIHLLNARKKNEKVKIKNSLVCIFIFLIAVGILAYCYYKVSVEFRTLSTIEKVIPVIVLGIVATILVFWSMSGFILRLVQAKKQTYLKGTNMFVLRQINNKINTTVISMSVICLMLFMTITILSTAISLRNTMEKGLKEMTPVDLNLTKTANLPEKSTNFYGKEVIYTKEQREDSRQSIKDTLIQNGMDMSKLKDIVEIPVYTSDGWTWKESFGNQYEEIAKQYPSLRYNTEELIIKVGDYNQVANLYGNQQYELNEDEYMVLCDFDSIKNIRNLALKEKNTVILQGKEYHTKYEECQNGFLEMSTSHTNIGIILVPDSCPLTNEMQEIYFLAANYQAETDEEKETIEQFFSGNSNLVQNLNDQGFTLDGMTKISLMESSIGLVTIIIFIAIYLGIIFLIACSAILALKQLTESSDNRERYIILRKIGCDEKMINQALFRQIGIFFLLPLVFAIIHSIFGIQFGIQAMEVLASKEELLPSASITVILIGVIYGAYFMATYLESKNIIREK